MAASKLDKEAKKVLREIEPSVLRSIRNLIQERAKRKPIWNESLDLIDKMLAE